MDEDTLATLRQCSAQADERTGYLIQIAAAVGGHSGFTRAYWQTLAKHQLDDRRLPTIRGSLAEAHADTQRALRLARAKATANAELGRIKRGSKDNG